jgi:fatty acid desaturase
METEPALRAAPPPSTGGDVTARQVHALVGDLMQPRPVVYHGDLVVSAAVGWAALLGATALFPHRASAPLFALGVAALFRAASFIHELTHLRPGGVPGFGVAWNALVGVPLLLPSFLYVSVHLVHHSKSHYGTRRDPEYLPLARWPAWTQALWVAEGALLPVALALRFLVLAPASLLHPRLRRFVWQRASSLSINPAFVRAPPAVAQRAPFAVQELAASAWAVAVAVLLARGLLAPRYVVAVAGAAAAVGLVNQLRTLVAHRWRLAGDEEPVSFEQQFLDSVNVTGGALPALWAPVGLRYHALHHLLPGLPYHALGEAHRRALAALPPDAPYHRASEHGLVGAVRRLTRA